MATNIVAEQVEVVAEARSLLNEKLDKQSGHMKECFEQAAREYGAGVDVTIDRSYAAFQLSPDTPAVKQCVEAMQRLESIEPKLQSTGGGSDCNVFNGHGITAVDLAIGMTDVHSKRRESIKISDMETVTRLIESIIEHNK